MPTNGPPSLGDFTVHYDPDREKRARREMVAADLLASHNSDVTATTAVRQQEIQGKLERDMHLMIDDLEIPPEDMTISSLS